MKRIVIVLCLLPLGCSSRKPDPPAPTDGTIGRQSGPAATPMVIPGIQQPPTLSAAKAELAADEEVIGVVVNGKARAYRLKAMKGMRSHVVNDVVERQAVTVTYCDREDCVRSYTDKRAEPLPIWLGGYREGMLLRIDGTFYDQKSGKTIIGNKEIPYRLLPYQRVKWGEWKKAHPESDVYLGIEGKDGHPMVAPREKMR